MFVTMCVIAYNEQESLPAVLHDICMQDYNHSDMEVVLVDSASTDATKKMMLGFQKENETDADMHFRRVVVCDNPKKTLPCGWNVALAAYQGDAIVKVDAHASIPVDFVTKNVAVLASGEYISGGQRPSMAAAEGKFSDTLLLAESSMFGAGIAPYRNNPGKTYVNSMFHAMYAREVFDTVGGFDERLVRTEDNEIHYRMRKAGFRLCFDPEIISYQQTRSSLKKMLKQKYANGYWIGLTTGVCPKCLSLYHYVPFAFVLAILFSAAVLLCDWAAKGHVRVLHVAAGIVGILTKLMWGMYGILAIGMSVAALFTHKKERNITGIALPILFFLLHVSYGIGTLAGFLKLPFWLKGHRNGRN